MPIIAKSFRYTADRLLFAAGLFAGSQLPVFVDQYRQRVGGRLDQAKIDLQPFQAIADRLHGGSLDALIQHHLNSSDATFHAEGQAIASISENVTLLSQSYAGLAADFWQQLWFLSSHYQPQVGVATWEVFTPGISITGPAIVFSLLVAFGFSVGLTLCFSVCRQLLGRLRLRKTSDVLSELEPESAAFQGSAIKSVVRR